MVGCQEGCRYLCLEGECQVLLKGRCQWVVGGLVFLEEEEILGRMR